MALKYKISKLNKMTNAKLLMNPIIYFSSQNKNLIKVQSSFYCIPDPNKKIFDPKNITKFYFSSLVF